MRLDAASPVPLYHQVAERLRGQLAGAGWPAGRRLPSESELCRAYGVTRPTIRQALEGLVREGLVVKRRGVGTYVAPPAPPVGLFSLTGTTEAFARQRVRLTTRLLSARLVEDCPLDPGAARPRRWVFLERLRRLNGRPALFERTWILAACAPGLEALELTDRSLYKALEGRYGLRLVGGVQRFFAVAADASVARALARRKGTPVLRVVRFLDLTGHPNAFRVELFVAEGPFVLEERVPGPRSGLELATASYLQGAGA